METMTPTRARGKLSSLLKRALKGEQIGIVVDGRIVALQPVEETPEEYVQREYGISPEEMKGFAARIHEEAKEAVRTGKSKTFNGDIEALIRD